MVEQGATIRKKKVSGMTCMHVMEAIPNCYGMRSSQKDCGDALPRQNLKPSQKRFRIPKTSGWSNSKIPGWSLALFEIVTATSVRYACQTLAIDLFNSWKRSYRITYTH
jgi:hypothetical protein